MSGQKSVRKRSRRQKALLAIAWGVCLFVLNLECNLIRIFPFQARRQLEISWEIEKTKVIWEAPSVATDGRRYFIAVNEDVAVFGGRKWTWSYGWNIFGVRLIPRNIQEPMYATEMTIVSFDERYAVHLLGLVKDDEIATIEYQKRWEDGAIKEMEIAEESYIYHGDERYYVQEAPSDFWYHPEMIETVAADKRIVCAKDRAGNIIYQGPIND